MLVIGIAHRGTSIEPEFNKVSHDGNRVEKCGDLQLGHPRDRPLMGPGEHGFIFQQKRIGEEPDDVASKGGIYDFLCRAC